MAAILRTTALSKSFGGLTAVDQVSLQIEPGEIFGIIGPNGAGKTTLFNLLTGNLRPTEGAIFFQGNETTGLSPEQVARRGISRTFQNIKLFKYLTVLENVKIGFHLRTNSGIFDVIFHTPKFRADEEFITSQSLMILDKVGLTNQAYELAGNLPYGTQRRVEIARALATRPSLLLLDEPAAGMNPAETKELVDFLQDLNRDGLTIAVIEHDMKLIMNLCHRITVLNYGRKICEDVPEKVQTNPEVIQAYLGKGLGASFKPREGGGTHA